jgi:hypothetical protein
MNLALREKQIRDCEMNLALREKQIKGLRD